MYFKLLINIGLIFTVVANDTNKYSENSSLDYVLDYRLPPEVVPRHYNIVLTLKEEDFTGESSIIIEVISRTAYISFHGYNLEIFQETIRLAKHEQNDDNPLTIAKWKEFSYCEESQIFALKFNKKLSPGYYTLNMKFRGILQRSHGFVMTSNFNATFGGEYVTLFERTGARRVFPCWDEPTFKATFDISVEHLSTGQVFSNMPCRSEERVGSQRTMTIFKPTPVMSTYLVTIVIMGSAANDVLGNNVELWVEGTADKHSRDIQKFAQLVNSFLTDYTNNLWINWRIGIIGYPKLPSTAMGAWGFAVFRQRDLIYKPDLHFPGRVFEIRKLIANEMTRQCIESFVSPMEWSHLWLSHAFATFLSYKITEKDYKEHYKKDIMMQLFVVQVLQPALHNDIALNVPPVMHEYDPIYASLIYKKASALIRMIEYIVTEEVLQKALVRYLKTYEYNSATPMDFFSILDSEIHRSQNVCNCSMTDIMHVWLSKRHHPIVTVYNLTMMSYLSIIIENIHDNGTKWPTPITYSSQANQLYSQDSPIIWLDNNSSQRDDHINVFGGYLENSFIVNKQQFGYYRVKYDNANLMKLASFLNSKNHEIIHVLNRAQMIDDAYHFVMEDHISYLVFYKLIKYLRKEHNFIVWHSMMNVLQYMSPFFNFPESMYFKKLILKVMTHVLNAMRYDEHPLDDDMWKATRLLLLNWACKHGHVKCRKKAFDKLLTHFNDNNTILPAWKDWTYCAGLMDADKYTSRIKILNILFKQKEDMSRYVGCINNNYLIYKLIILASSAHTSQDKWAEMGHVQSKELYYALVKKHARKPKVLKFLLINIRKILPGRINIVEKIVDIIMSVYSNCHLDKILKHVNDNFNWDSETTQYVERLITFRRNQIQKQKEMFSKRFYHGNPVDEC